jgi:hypothetical protein
MKFFSSQTRATYSPPVNNIMQMSMSIRPLRQPSQSIQQNIEKPIIDNAVKKVKWGEPTWYLFHTLSVKIKENQFHIIRTQLLNQIYAICVNLPCPECANHAKTYLEGINFSSIKTKTDLKKFLYTFHNIVNKRKGYPLFPYDELDGKYSKANTVPIIQNFMIHFSDRNRSVKLLATDLYRQRLCETLKEWFNNNITAFDH